MSCESKCAKWFRSGDAACKGCGSCERCKPDDEAESAGCANGLDVEDELTEEDCEECDQENCPHRLADFIDDDNVDADGVGDSDIVTDEYGNEGTKFYDVRVTHTRTQKYEETIRVAAFDDTDAASNATQVACDRDVEALDWEDADDSPNFHTGLVEEADERGI